MPNVGTAVATIISDAYREANITALGTLPTAAQQAEALDALNRVITSVYGDELGEQLSDWLVPNPQRTAPVAANYPQLPYANQGYGVAAAFNQYPPKNTRIIWGGNTTTVWLPEKPDNGSRIALIQGSGLGDNGADGNVLTIDGNGRYLNSLGATQQTFVFSTAAPIAAGWLYLAGLGLWTPITELALTDNLPFPQKHDDFWITALMIRLAPRYNKVVSPETKGAFQLAMDRLISSYTQSDVTVYGAWDFPNSLQSYISGRYYLGN